MKLGKTFTDTLMKITHCKTLKEVSTENNIPLETLTTGLVNLKENVEYKHSKKDGILINERSIKKLLESI